MSVGDQDKRIVYLAVDKQKSFDKAMSLISGVFDGPMQSYMAGCKFNDALHASGWGGPDLIDEVISLCPGRTMFIDLKLMDVGDTIINTIRHYYGHAKLLVTVSVHCSAQAYQLLNKEFPELEIAVMGVPTDIKHEEFINRYGMVPFEAMEKWYGGLVSEYRSLTKDQIAYPNRYAISSIDMLEMLAEKFPVVNPVTPAIRDNWMKTQNQQRVVSSAQALIHGAKRLVIGNQLFNGNPEVGISAHESQRLTAVELETYFQSLVVA